MPDPFPGSNIIYILETMDDRHSYDSQLKLTMELVKRYIRQRQA